MQKTVGEIAKLLGGTLYGNPDIIIKDVKSAESAGPEHATFAKGVYVEYINQFKAGVILVDSPIENCDKNLIVVRDCRGAFGKLIEIFHPEKTFAPQIHPTAVIGKNVKISESACIMAYTVIGDNVTVDEKTVIFPFVYIGENSVIGKNCEINPGAVIHENTVIGDKVVIRAHAVVGSQGFGFSTDENGHHTHIRQLGKIVVGDDVELGAGTTVDNGAINDTVIRRGTKIDNLVHLGHNVEVGEDCFIIAQTGVAGSTKIGNKCVLAGQSGVVGHVKIADNVTVGAKSAVIGNISESGFYVGFPAKKHAKWGRIEATLNKLPDILKKVRKLDKTVTEFENKLKNT